MRTLLRKDIMAIGAVAAMMCSTLPAMAQQRPTRLTTQLLEHTDRVWENGTLLNISLGEMHTAIENMQTAEITAPHPMLAWIMPDGGQNTMQTAYRVLVASKADLLTEGMADVWDSGKREGSRTSGVRMEGEPLNPQKTYYWTVKTWDNHGNESQYAQPRALRTARVMTGAQPTYPLSVTDETAVSVKRHEASQFADFGRAAFGRLRITLTSTTDHDTVRIHLGEKQSGGHVDRKPGAKIRYAAYTLPLMRGTHTYTVKFAPDRKNANRRKANGSKVNPIFMPGYIGEVYPFRYAEVEGYDMPLKQYEVVRHTVSYPFDDTATRFQSSDTVLNRVWELCRYSMKATSFAGTYIDGDRERIPYEGDALINQLGHYASDRDFSMARHSAEHLQQSPTWPTEWILEQVIMAWQDYMYTADTALLARTYDILVPKALMMLRDDNGLISTRTGKVTPSLFKQLNFKGRQMTDITDWPQTGAKGDGKENEGEADGFVFTDYNSIVNALHYEAVRLLGEMAGVIGRDDDAARYKNYAQRFKAIYNKAFFDSRQNRYRDGIGTDHASLHANMTAMAVGLVDAKHVQAVADYVKSRGMACSVYGAQWLLDALYSAEEGEHALQLMASTAKRSWYNMLRVGSTVTLEAWDADYKPNLDWNHAWGAAPANTIARGLFGIQPMEPGFERFRVKPQFGSLQEAEITVPSVKGDISVNYNPGGDGMMRVTIPTASRAEIWMPAHKNTRRVTVDGQPVKARRSGGYLVVELGSGTYSLLAQ